MLPVRDSANPTGPAVVLDPGAWTAFLTGVQRDHLVRCEGEAGPRPPPGSGPLPYPDIVAGRPVARGKSSRPPPDSGVNNT